MFSPIFVADTKIIFGYKFFVSLKRRRQVPRKHIRWKALQKPFPFDNINSKKVIPIKTS